MNEQIPSVEVYRGVKIHDRQPARRIAVVVKPEIDGVYALTDAPMLVAFADDPKNSPEARLFAAARAEAIAAAAAGRRDRVEIDMDQLVASVAGLDSEGWRSPWRYCALIDLDHDRAVEREAILPELRADGTRGE